MDLSDVTSIRELGERLWKGGDGGSPVSFKSALLNETEEFCDGKALFVNSFANALAIDCGEGGVVMVDSGSIMFSACVHELVCDWRKEKKKGLVKNVIWTHHHVDHVYGVNLYEEEGPVTVYSHKNIPGHFKRYRYTQGYNGHINGRQFQTGVNFPSEFRFPDVTYDEKYVLNVGDQTFHLHHGMGETDDATWVWIPKLKAVATGDLFIWCCPNCGNPAKAQRYCEEWAQALRQMIEYEPEYLFPGHGPPIWGRDRVRLALSETAELLETIQQQTIELMNQGKNLDEVIRGVVFPEKLLARPYLRPVYDDPEFIIRNIWRRYGGWFGGFPPSLQPPSHPSLGKGVSELVEGGALGLAKKARKLLESGDAENLRIARYFADWAALAAEQEPNQTKKNQQKEAVNAIRAKIYEQSAEKETSLMARGVYTSAMIESEDKLKENEGQPERLKANL